MLLALPMATAQTPSGGSNTMLLILAVVGIGALWLMSSRSRKQQKAAQEARNNLVPGDEVMTASGLFGTVVGEEGDVITLEVSPGVTTRWVRAAIMKKVEPAAVAETEAEADEQDPDYDEFEVPDDLSSLDDGPDRTGKDDPEK
jgi:preprotein translocase subunit YajC